MSPEMSGTFTIAGRQVGGGAAPLIIAEVAQAHDGSLGIFSEIARAKGGR